MRCSNCGGCGCELCCPNTLGKALDRASIAKVKGVGPDAPITTNAKGGKQSLVPFRCDLLPPLAALRVAEVLEHGATKYGPKNWHAIAVEEHLNHMLAHTFAYLAGDTQDDHLGHAACRAFMALDQLLSHRDDVKKA